MATGFLRSVMQVLPGYKQVRRALLARQYRERNAAELQDKIDAVREEMYLFACPDLVPDPLGTTKLDTSGFEPEGTIMYSTLLVSRQTQDEANLTLMKLGNPPLLPWQYCRDGESAEDAVVRYTERLKARYPRRLWKPVV